MKYGFVVEGFNDETKLLKVLPNAQVVVTKGTRLNNRVKSDINDALATCDKVFLLTDPDEAGDLLSSMILEVFPFLERVLLNKKECLCYRNHKTKVGVEHCSDEYLSLVLKQHLK